MEENEPDFNKKLTKQELISMLEEEIKGYERLPPHAMSSPLLVMDHLSLLMLLLSIFKAED